MHNIVLAAQYVHFRGSAIWAWTHQRKVYSIDIGITNIRTNTFIMIYSLHIRSRKTGILFSLLSCSLWWVQTDTFWLADRVHLFVHYTISLSSLCKLFWRHWTYKMPVRYILFSLWVRLGIFSHLSITQYMGLCVFSLPISLVMIETICTLSYYHHQIGSVNYYPLFRVRSWNNGMRCLSFYIRIYTSHQELIYRSLISNKIYYKEI